MIDFDISSVVLFILVQVIDFISLIGIEKRFVRKKSFCCRVGCSWRCVEVLKVVSISKPLQNPEIITQFAAGGNSLNED